MDKITLPMILASPFHSPVLPNEVLEGLQVSKGKKFIDATIGGGSHSLGILLKGGRVLGIDRDTEALSSVKNRLAQGKTEFKIGEDIILVHGNFADLKKIAEANDFENADGILFDLGISTNQLEKSGRGFSIQKEEPLDMRMDLGGEKTAEKIINTYSEEKLYEIFSTYAEELNSGSISEAIIRARTIKKIRTTSDFAEIITGAIKNTFQSSNRYQNDKITRNTLARIFQAVRIEVNGEIESFKKALEDSISLLNNRGRIAVISFHSLEDRIVKLTFRNWEKMGQISIITKNPIRAGTSETAGNPKAISAKLRIAEKKYAD